MALGVGAVLFLINHIDEVVGRGVSAGTWSKGVATCLVPFAVTNWGILAATHKGKSHSTGPRAPASSGIE